MLQTRRIHATAGAEVMRLEGAFTGYWLSSQLGQSARSARTISELMRYLASDKLDIIVGQTFPWPR